MRCDVCGLPDPYRGQGDGIGSCDCPRCDCGTARSSVLCTCPPDDDGMCSCESYDCQGECCGPGQCSCTPADDDDEPWPDDVYIRPTVTVHLPAKDVT